MSFNRAADPLRTSARSPALSAKSPALNRSLQASVLAKTADKSRFKRDANEIMPAQEAAAAAAAGTTPAIATTSVICPDGTVVEEDTLLDNPSMGNVENVTLSVSRIDDVSRISRVSRRMDDISRRIDDSTQLEPGYQQNNSTVMTNHSTATQNNNSTRLNTTRSNNTTRQTKTTQSTGSEGGTRSQRGSSSSQRLVPSCSGPLVLRNTSIGAYVSKIETEGQIIQFELRKVREDYKQFTEDSEKEIRLLTDAIENHRKILNVEQEKVRKVETVRSEQEKVFQELMEKNEETQAIVLKLVEKNAERDSEEQLLRTTVEKRETHCMLLSKDYSTRRNTLEKNQDETDQVLGDLEAECQRIENIAGEIDEEREFEKNILIEQLKSAQTDLSAIEVEIDEIRKKFEENEVKCAAQKKATTEELKREKLERDNLVKRLMQETEKNKTLQRKMVKLS